MVLTAPRRALLAQLMQAGGHLEAHRISASSRRLATIMQRDGLVRWRAPAISSRHTCLGQTLFITDAGRAALAAADARAHGINPAALAATCAFEEELPR